MRTFLLIGGVSLVLFGQPTLSKAEAPSVSLPAKCKLSPQIGADLAKAPSAKVYDAAGAWFGQRGDYSCAVAAFRVAVQLRPDFAEAQFNLGLAEASLRQPAEAEKHLRLAIKFDPRITAAHTSLGTVLLEQNRPVEAEVEFRAVLAAETPSVRALDNLALSLSAQKRHVAAIGVWKQALALQPDDPVILLSVAVATYEDGQTSAAIDQLNGLIAAHPDSVEAHFTLGNIYAHSLLYAEAAKEYAVVVRLEPDNADALLAFVKASSNAGAYEASVAPAEAYIGRRPADPDGHLVLGSIYRRLGKYGKAEEQLSLAVSAWPEDSHAQYELGYAFFRDQQPTLALQHLEKAFALDSSDAATQFALAAVLRKLGDTKRAAEITELLVRHQAETRDASVSVVKGSEANMLLSQGEPARAVELYRQMLTTDPKNAQTEYNLALALAGVHDAKGEREALEKAVELDPRMAPAQSELGVMDLVAGDTTAAERRLRTALAIDPQLASAKGNLGLIYALKQDLPNAERLFREAVQDDPKYVRGYLNLGLVLASRGDFAGAEAALEHASELAPADAAVNSALGKVKARLGKNEQALAAFRKNVAAAPQSPDAHLELAIALADSYDLKAALQQAEEAVRLAPRSASAQFNRGRILFDLGRVADARASLREACGLAPTMPEPRYYLALLEKQQGNLEAAARLFHEVIDLQPGNVRALYFLGQCLQSSDKQAAIDVWRRAVAADPGYTPALWSLTRALTPVDPAEAERYAAKLKLALSRKHELDQAELTANHAVAAMEAHDWPEAVKGMKEAIATCGECAEKANLHESLGLAYCHAGDLDDGEKELLYADSLKPNNPEIKRALALVAQDRSAHSDAPPH